MLTRIVAQVIALGLAVAAATVTPVAAAAVPELPPFVRAATDQAEFRRLSLDNGLRVLLVSDARFNKSGAALVVNAGQIDDPPDAQGLAHLLEHMLFLGTDKFPDEGEYQRYVRRNGGSHNAYTGSDHTNYHLEVRHEALAGALDRLAQFFVAPRFSPEFTQRELTAVDNEAMRYEQSDGLRLANVLRELYAPGSGERSFGFGNRRTLAGADAARVRAFYLQHYSADRMALAIAGKAPLDELERLARTSFAALPRRALPAVEREPRFLPPKPALRLALVEPVREVRSLRLEFVMPATRPDFAARSDRLVLDLIEHAGAGGLLDRLKREGLANDLGATLFERTGNYGSLIVGIDLTPAGAERHQRVLELLFAYLEQLRQAPFPQAFRADRARIGALQETYGNRGEGASLALRLANQALFYPLEVAERAGSAWGAPDEPAYRRLLAALTPDRMLAALLAKGVPTDRVESIFGARYSLREDSGDAYRALLHPRPGVRFELPAANRFAPGATALLSEQPLVLIDEPALQLHYAADTEFERPQTSVVFRFVPLRALAGAESTALLSLWGRCLADALDADLTEARAAGLAVGQDLTLEGLKFSITGFGDSAPRFARHLAGLLRGFTLSPERFAAVRETELRVLRSYPQAEAYALARDRRDAMVREVYHLPHELEARSMRAGWPEVQAFGQRLLAAGRLEVLVHGHTAPDDAVAMARALAGLLGAQAAPPDALLRRRQLVVSPGEHLVDAGAIAGPNSVYLDDYELPGDTARMRAASLLIGAAIAPPYYTEMRTRQQLGYIAGASVGALLRQRYLTFVIQSSEYGPDELRRRSEAMIARLPALLAAMPGAEWTTLKAGVRSSLEARPKSIGERAERWFADATLFAREWDRRRDTLAALDTLSPAEVRQILQTALDAATAQRRTVLLHAARHAPKDAPPASFDDLQRWKRTRTYR